ncbi:MAG: hypothetical protein AMXMBFR23_02100 [Chloroflexota bacterium]
MVVVGIALAVAGSTLDHRFETNGERIYFTGRNEEGQRIAYAGGATSGLTMAGGLNCASCHGGNAEGGQHRMHMLVMDAPDIRWSTLMAEAEGGHGASATYDLATFRGAVVDGLHPDGEPLSDVMPRWQLSDRDLSALASYLRSLQE